MAAASKRDLAPKLQQQIERLSQLPMAKQKVVMEMIDGVLQDMEHERSGAVRQSAVCYRH